MLRDIESLFRLEGARCRKFPTSGYNPCTSFGVTTLHGCLSLSCRLQPLYEKIANRSSILLTISRPTAHVSATRYIWPNTPNFTLRTPVNPCVLLELNTSTGDERTVIFWLQRRMRAPQKCVPLVSPQRQDLQPPDRRTSAQD
jgi:hypothetical protein